MDIKALQLCARFALQPNQLGYCGKDSASTQLQRCLLTGNCDGVESELEKFIVLHPYLQTIAQITGKDKFSYVVIEAYWLGNDLLKLCKPKHYQLLIKNLETQGVPPWLISEIKAKQPKAFIPIHLFNILHVGVGRASGSVAFTPYSINHCMLRWGVVKKIIDDKEKKAEVKLIYLENKNHGFQFITKTETVQVTQLLTPNFKIGDRVIAHWRWVAKKINQREKAQLAFWTKQLLRYMV